MKHCRARTAEDRRKFRLDALDAVDAIEATDTVERLYALLERAFGAFSFEHFIISGIPLPNERLERAVVLRNWPAGWFDMYAREDFVRVDPTVRLCHATTMPFEWCEAPIDLRDSRGRDVMNFARDFGLRRGFSLPIHNFDGSVACVSMGGRDPDLDSCVKPSLHLVATYAFEHARKFACPRTQSYGANPLTPREQEVLTWAAVGKSYSDIAEILCITERTVTAHSVNAAVKLGAPNKTAAIVKALKARLIAI